VDCRSDGCPSSQSFVGRWSRDEVLFFRSLIFAQTDRLLGVKGRDRFLGDTGFAAALFEVRRESRALSEMTFFGKAAHR